MRYLALCLLVFAVNCVIAQVNHELIGAWVERYSEAGLIMDFRKDGAVIIGNVRIDSTKTARYKFDGDLGELFVEYLGSYRSLGNVKGLTKNEFKLLLPDSSRMFFVKIKDIRPRTTRQEIIENLSGSAWMLKGDKDSLRIDFSSHRLDDSLMNESNSPLPYASVSHYWQSSPSKSRKEWDIGTYDGKLFLFYSNHSTERSVTQIKEFNSTQLSLTEPTMMVDGAVDLVKKRVITAEENTRLTRRLCSKTWTSIKVDTIFTGRVDFRVEDNAIKLIDPDLKFEFTFNNERSYALLPNGVLIQKGKWKFSNDGEFIIMDEGKKLVNWIQVRMATEGLILSKLHNLISDDSMKE